MFDDSLLMAQCRAIANRGRLDDPEVQGKIQADTVASLRLLVHAMGDAIMGLSRDLQQSEREVRDLADRLKELKGSPGNAKS